MEDLQLAASPRLTRRHLVVAGAAGAATAWLGGLTRLETLAQAATGGAPAQLRRSTYLSLSTPDFQAVVEGDAVPLKLVGVGDLPIAESVSELQGHDGAFAVRFRGSGDDALARGTRTMRHPDLGTFDLFVAPVDQRGDAQDYEAIVDRTLRIPDLDDEGAPDAVRPGAHASSELAETGSGGAARRRSAPRLLRASLRRSRSGRKLLAEVALGNGAEVRSVHALLLRRGRLVASASADARRRRRLLLRFGGRGPARRGRYTLLLTAIEGDGRVTRVRRALRLR